MLLQDLGKLNDEIVRLKFLTQYIVKCISVNGKVIRGLPVVLLKMAKLFSVFGISPSFIHI